MSVPTAILNCSVIMGALRKDNGSVFGRFQSTCSSSPAAAGVRSDPADIAGDRRLGGYARAMNIRCAMAALSQPEEARASPQETREDRRRIKELERICDARTRRSPKLRLCWFYQKN